MGKDLKGKELGRGFSQRKDGRYEARAIVNGKKIDLYDFNLEKLTKAFSEEKQRIKYSNNDFDGIVTLKDWYMQWFEKVKAPSLKSEQSKKTYNRKVKNTFIRLLGDKKIKSITQMDIQNAANELFDEKYTTRSIREAISILKSCLDVAIINRVINVNVCKDITIKDDNLKPKERRVLTHKEQKIFLNEAKGSYYYEAYCILLCTGMRIGEFSGLQWRDVDFENKVININRSMQTAYVNGKKIEELTTPKTNNSYRKIPFFDETEKLFKQWKNKQDKYKKQLGDRWRANPELGDLVFTSTMGSPATRYVIAHDIKRIINNINITELYKATREGRQPVKFENVYPHAFRHTFATRCFEKGLDPIFVQNIMGHSNYTTTVSYTHLLEEERTKQVKSVGEFLA